MAGLAAARRAGVTRRPPWTRCARRTAGRPRRAVEIACTSGRSRTGTALAALAVRAGLETDEAVAWVRADYPPARIVTRRQRRWLAESAAELRRAVPV